MSHWYGKGGEPMHEVPNASKPGLMRATTVRDARKLGLWPSVTTVQKTLAKGMMLDEWLIDQALYAALVHPKGFPRCTLQEDGSVSFKDPEFVAWAKQCKADARAQVQVKAERGSILHDMMMRAHHAYDTVPPQYLAHVDGMFEMLHARFGTRQWIAEGSFCNTELGFGGSIDLRTLPDDPDPIILDYKFKEFDDTKKASYFIYDEHRMQLGGYSIGPGDYTKARLFNAFSSITEPGLVLIHEHSAEDAQYGRDLFLATLRVWQTQNGYAPK